MIKNDEELHVALERIRRFQDQIARLRHTEPDPENYRASAGGFLAEVDRMQLEVREFLSHHPAEAITTE
jgi:hypothetical protein